VGVLGRAGGKSCSSIWIDHGLCCGWCGGGCGSGVGRRSLLEHGWRTALEGKRSSTDGYGRWHTLEGRLEVRGEGVEGREARREDRRNELRVKRGNKGRLWESRRWSRGSVKFHFLL
jgi:hypothetical protein